MVVVVIIRGGGTWWRAQVPLRFLVLFGRFGVALWESGRVCAVGRKMEAENGGSAAIFKIKASFQPPRK